MTYRVIIHDEALHGRVAAAKSVFDHNKNRSATRVLLYECLAVCVRLVFC